MSQTLGNGYVSVPGLGAVNFTDVGDHIGGYTESTLGVLISYQGQEVMFAYEGDGEIEMTINELGQAELSGNGGFSRLQNSAYFVLTHQA